MTIGTTIHDEAVTVEQTPRAWAVKLDGVVLGLLRRTEGEAVLRALELVPEHRRQRGVLKGGSSAASYYVVGEHRGYLTLQNEATGTTTNAPAAEFLTEPRDVANERGLSAARAKTTDDLAASFRLTDALLEQKGLTPDQHAELSVARGWILEVLEAREELAAIGLDAEYRQLLSPGDRVRIVSAKSRLHGTLATVTAADSQQTIVQPDGEAESPVCVWKSDDVVVLERVEGKGCEKCGSADLCYGVDERDVEDGSYVCEGCEHRGAFAS